MKSQTAGLDLAEILTPSLENKEFFLLGTSLPANHAAKIEGKTLGRALEKIEITASDLRFLAIARAQAARDYLLEAGISGDRIFLLEPGTGIAGEDPDPDLKSSRVDFQLK